MLINSILAVITIAIWVIRGTMFFYMAVPIFIVAGAVLIFSLKHYKTTIYKYCFVFFIHLFFSPLYIIAFSFLASSLFSSTDNYSIGIDIRTPEGNLSIVNNITIEDKTNPFKSLRSFYTGYSVVKGESNGIELDEDKSVIILLSPPGSNTLSFLKNIQKWVRQADISTKNEHGVKKHILPSRQIPTIIFLDDIQQPKHLSVVAPDAFEKTFGPKFSLINSWVAFEQINSSTPHTIEKWWHIKDKDQSNRHSMLRNLGVPHDRYIIYWKSDTSFLRI